MDTGANEREAVRRQVSAGLDVAFASIQGHRRPELALEFRDDFCGSGRVDVRRFARVAFQVVEREDGAAARAEARRAPQAIKKNKLPTRCANAEVRWRRRWCRPCFHGLVVVAVI